MLNAVCFLCVVVRVLACTGFLRQHCAFSQAAQHSLMMQGICMAWHGMALEANITNNDDQHSTNVQVQQEVSSQVHTATAGVADILSGLK